MSDLLVLTAALLEARGLARELELGRLRRLPFAAFEGSRGAGRLRLAPVGLRAALLPDRWRALAGDLDRPLVVSAGICGGLLPELEAGDPVLPESVIGPAGERWNATPGAHVAALRAAPGARTEPLLTTTDLLSTPEAKAERREATGAVAVDLESAGILAWASRQGCPSLVVRAVADTARQELPAELEDLLTREGKLLAGRALALALSRPATIRLALTLSRGRLRALKSVARVIAALAG